MTTREQKELRREVRELRKGLRDVNKRLEIMYDRMCLALDGERPPRGVLSTLDALAPFTRLAEKLLPLADLHAYTDDAMVFVDGDGVDVSLPTRGRVRAWLTVGHFRDAARTYAWATGKKRVKP
jgi:hypothetical protein